MRYLVRDTVRALGAEIHRLHCRIAKDDEFGLEEYAWIYGPYAIYVIIFVVTWFIVHGFG